MIKILTSKHGVVLEGYQVTLEPVQEQHLGLLREWRNSDAVRVNMCSTEVISPQQQLNWYQRIRKSNTECHWVIRYKDTLIGSTNLKSLDNLPVDNASKVEAGLYIGEAAYCGNIIAFSPTLLVYDYCFETLNVKQIFAHVKAANKAALKYNQTLGYRQLSEQSSDQAIALAVDQQDYSNATVNLRNMLSRQSKR